MLRGVPLHRVQPRRAGDRGTSIINGELAQRCHLDGVALDQSRWWLRRPRLARDVPGVGRWRWRPLADTWVPPLQQWLWLQHQPHLSHLRSLRTLLQQVALRVWARERTKYRPVVAADGVGQGTIVRTHNEHYSELPQAQAIHPTSPAPSPGSMHHRSDPDWYTCSHAHTREGWLGTECAGLGGYR